MQINTRCTLNQSITINNSLSSKHSLWSTWSHFIHYNTEPTKCVYWIKKRPKWCIYDALINSNIWTKLNIGWKPHLWPELCIFSNIYGLEEFLSKYRFKSAYLDRNIPIYVYYVLCRDNSLKYQDVVLTREL